MVHSWHGYQRSIMRGVADYAQRHGPWALSIDNRLDSGGDARPLLAPIDGLLVEAWSDRARDAMKASRVPMVGVLADSETVAAPTVADDEGAIVEVALEHMRGLGLPHVVYVDIAWTATGRRTAFARATGAADGDDSIFPKRPVRSPPATVRAKLIAWVKRLPTPVGVFAHNVDLARDVVEACDEAGLRVPDDVAVLGFGGDDLACNLATPPISSIDGGGERIGYRAAEMLDRMMRGERVPIETVRVPPLRVVQRRSTDTLAVEDAKLAAALRFIRDNACEGITVSDVLAEAPMSRRVLEYACRNAIGRTPHQEIQRIQLDEAKRLLEQTDLPLADVAVRSGLGLASRLCQVFARQVGQSPSTYRRHTRRG